MPRVLGSGLGARAWTFSLAAVALLAACQRDHRFHTVAVYEASRGRYSILIEATGVVVAGHDLSERSSGMLTVSPVAIATSEGPARMVVEIALHESEVQLGPERFAQGSGSDRGEAAVVRLLSNAGYPVRPDEVAEMVSATEGVLLGPKGTLMSGQTKVLSVASIRFD